MEGADVFVKYVSTVGFPIAIAWYMMTTFKKALDGVFSKLGELVTEVRLLRGGAQNGN